MKRIIKEDIPPQILLILKITRVYNANKLSLLDEMDKLHKELP